MFRLYLFCKQIDLYLPYLDLKNIYLLISASCRAFQRIPNETKKSLENLDLQFQRSGIKFYVKGAQRSSTVEVKFYETTLVL